MDRLTCALKGHDPVGFRGTFYLKCLRCGKSKNILTGKEYR